MRKLMIVVFAVGVIWLFLKEIQYGRERYFSEWAVVSKNLPDNSMIDRDSAIESLRELNARLHENHKSYAFPCLLLVIGGVGLIFSRK